MGVAVVAVLFPLAWVLRVATKTEEGFISDPASLGGGFTLDNFGAAWDAVDLGGAIADSLSITLPGAALATIVGLLAGYAFAKLPIPFRAVVLALAVGGLTIPVAALVIPQFDQALALGLRGHALGLIVVYGAFYRELEQPVLLQPTSGTCRTTCWKRPRIDGASARVAFTSVALPLAVPAVAVGFVLNVFLQWSELLLGLIMLPGGDVTTAMTAIATFSTQFRTGGPLTAAATVDRGAARSSCCSSWRSAGSKTEIFGGSVKG